MVLSAVFDGTCRAVAAPEAELDFAHWSVPQFLAYAREHNPLYLAAAQSVKLAEADLITAGLLPNPVLSYQEQFIGGLAKSQGGQTERAPGIAMDIDISGRWFKRQEAARHALRAQAFGYEEFDRLFRSTFTRAFFRHLFLQEQVTIRKRFLENYEKLVAASRTRAASGDLSRFELDRLELERLRYEADEGLAEQQVETSMRGLLRLLGEAADGPLPSLPRKLEFKPLAALGVRVDTAGPNHRPDLARLEAELAQSQSIVGLKRREAFPKLSWNAEYRFKGPEKYPGFGFSLALPLFDRNQGEIARAEANRRILEHRVEARRLEIQSEIQTALSELRRRERLLLDWEARGLLSKNESVGRRALEAYVQRAYSLVAFLESQRETLKVQQDYYEQLYLYYLAIESYETAVSSAGSSATSNL